MSVTKLKDGNLKITDGGREYIIGYSADEYNNPYGIVLPGESMFRMLHRDRSAKMAWKRLKPIIDKHMNEHKNINEVNVELNKKIAKLILDFILRTSKNTYTHIWIVKELLKAALTDANFHSEAKRVDAIFTKWAKQPDTDIDTLLKAIRGKGEDIARIADWDGNNICTAFYYYISAKISGGLGNKVKGLVETMISEKIDVSYENKNISEANYHNKADALNAYFQGKISAQELNDIAKNDFKSSVASKKELADFLKNGFTQDVMADTYGIPKNQLVKKARELVRFAESVSLSETKFYAFWNGKKHEIEGTSLWDAKQKAITQLKVPKSKVGLLAIVNAGEHERGSFKYEQLRESTRRSNDFFKEYIRGVELDKLFGGKFDSKKFHKFIDKYEDKYPDAQFVRMLDIMGSRLGMNTKSYDNKPVHVFIKDLESEVKKLYNIHINESMNESDQNVLRGVKKKGDTVYVDSNFINFCQNILPNTTLKHMGFGEFYLKTPNGDIQFARVSERFPNFVGRAHRMYDDKGGKLVAELLKAMTKKYKDVKPVSESNWLDGEFVVYVDTKKGKRLINTFKSGRAAQMFLNKNQNKYLNDPTVNQVGMIPKTKWDKEEAKYAIEGSNVAKQNKSLMESSKLSKVLQNDIAKALRVSPSSISVGVGAFVPIKTNDGNLIVVIGLDTKVKVTSIPQADFYDKTDTYGGYLVVKVNPNTGKLLKVLNKYESLDKIKPRNYINENMKMTKQQLKEIIREEIHKLNGLYEGRAFVAAAKKAKDEGKSEFEFNGRTYPVTIKESINPNYFPSFSTEDTNYLLIGTKNNIIASKSRYSDVGTHYRVYDKGNKYMGTANSIKGGEGNFKKIPLKKSMYSGVKSMADLLKRAGESK